MIVSIYGEYYYISVDYFNDVKIVKVKQHNGIVFIDVEKSGRKIKMLMNLDDYKTINRHKKISELGV